MPLLKTCCLHQKTPFAHTIFFVALDKVLGNVSKVEIPLNILNSLIGKDNLSERLAEIIRSYPEVVPVIPLLIAVRETNIRIADLSGDIEYSFFKRKSYSDDEISKIVEFTDKCGFLKIISDKAVKNLVGYCVGVEVGLTPMRAKTVAAMLWKR